MKVDRIMNLLSFGLVMLFFAQNSIYSAQYQAALSNSQKIDDKTYEFEFIIKSNVGDFNLTSYQCAFSFNSAIVNGGSLTFSYINGSSELTNIPQSGSFSIISSDGNPELCFSAMPGNDVITSTFKRIGRFRLVNSKSFFSATSDVTWDFSGMVQTIITTTGYSDVTADGEYFNLDDSAPLPVELSLFDINSNDNKVMLNWITETEINVNNFEIERRSLKNNIWEKVGTIKATGNSSSQVKYSYTDKINTTGEYVYRLKTVDLNGTYKYSDEKTIEVKTPAEFSLEQNYPNPFNPETSIKFNLKTDCRVKLNIYSVTGELVTELINEEKSSGFYSVNWNANNLPSGIYIYLLQASSKDGQNFKAINKMLLLK